MKKMSTLTEGGGSKPDSEGDSKSAGEGPSKKTYHERSKRSPDANRGPMILEVITGNRLMSKYVRCLKDFMKDPKRTEPLIGLEYILEIRYEGKRMPSYECQLCAVSMELLPLIEHVTSIRHRKRYLKEHYPEKVRKPTDHREEAIDYYRRVARELEMTKGLKMYEREEFERPSTTGSTKKKVWLKSTGGYRPENDPVRRQKALDYMEKFEITSDREAAQVMKIAQSLSKDLKKFCENKATIQYIKTLPSLMSQGEIDEKQSKDQPGGGSRRVTGGLAKLNALMQQGPSTSRRAGLGYGSRRNPSLPGQHSKDLSTVSALKSSFSFQFESFHSGINEWMKQFNYSASAFSQSAAGEETLTHVGSVQSNYTMQCNQEDNITIDSGVKNWDTVGGSHDSNAHPLTPTAYPHPRLERRPRRRPSRFSSEFENTAQIPSSSCSSESNLASWLQQQQPEYLPTNPGGHLGSYSFVSGDSSHQDYHAQNAQVAGATGISGDEILAILNHIRGHDVATLESMLLQLLPHYPDLQKINISAFAQSLSEISELKEEDFYRLRSYCM